MKLYEIADQVERLLAECVDPETGEITDEAAAELDQLEMARDEKALAVAAYLKGEECEAAAVKAEADRLAKRVRTHQNRARWLHDYLATYFPQDHKASNANTRLTWAGSPAAVVLDPDVEAHPEAKLCERFLRRTVVPNKIEIGNALKAGETVPGAKLVKRTSLRIA